MERAFFMDSSMSDVAVPAPTIWVNAGASGGAKEFPVIVQGDYQQELVGQEKVRVQGLKVACLLRAPTTATTVPWVTRQITLMLVRGRAEDVTEFMVTQNANPNGALPQVIEYQELTRNIRVLKRRTFMMDHFGDDDRGTTALSIASDTMWAMQRSRALKYITMSVRKSFWLREPEQVSLICSQYIAYMPSGTAGNTVQVNGNYQVMCSFHKY